MRGLIAVIQQNVTVIALSWKTSLCKFSSLNYTNNAKLQTLLASNNHKGLRKNAL